MPKVQSWKLSIIGHADWHQLQDSSQSFRFWELPFQQTQMCKEERMRGGFYRCWECCKQVFSSLSFCRCKFSSENFIWPLNHELFIYPSWLLCWILAWIQWRRQALELAWGVCPRWWGATTFEGPWNTCHNSATIRPKSLPSQTGTPIRRVHIQMSSVFFDHLSKFPLKCPNARRSDVSGIQKEG